MSNNTFNAADGKPEAIPATAPMRPPWTVPSIINIPPQISTTLVWVGLGIAIGWYLATRPTPRRSIS